MALSPDIFRPSADFVQTLKAQDQRFARFYGDAVQAEEFARRARISQFEVERIARLANIVQLKANHGGLREQATMLREVDPQPVANALEALTGEGGRVVMMRHGGQTVNPQVALMSDDLKKIRMMQLPFNMFDPLSAHSRAEAFGTAIPLRVAQERTGKTLEIRTSENARALQLAVLIARIANAGSFLIDRRLTCVNYRSIGVSDEQLLQWLAESKGSLPWKPEIVNRVCGEGTFEKIVRDVDRVITEGIANPNKIVLCITHTQQTNACDEREWETPTRYAELGMRIIQPQTSFLLKNGIYANSS